jgi:predicted alpha-1,6-mannanase (GH76 family)
VRLAGIGLLLCIVLSTFLCLALAVAGSATARDTVSKRDTLAQARALAAYAAMQRYFYSPGDGSYAGTYPSPRKAQAWPFSQALWATLDVAAIPGADPDARADLLQRVRALAAYSRPEPGRPAEFAPVYGGQGVVYNDDNLWIALGLVDASNVVSGTHGLATARELFAVVGDGWDASSSDPCPGGVFWTRNGTNRDRNAVTTANAALLALGLYRTSSSHSYLAWAENAYAWTKRCLGRPDGLVGDHIDLRGDIDEHTWSYNQGAMIAAGVRLFHATGSTSRTPRRPPALRSRRSAIRSPPASRRCSSRSSTATCSS